MLLFCFVLFCCYSTLEPTRWIGKAREQLTEIWFCDQWIVERMSPTSDWNTYQHFERSEYEVENVCVLSFNFSSKSVFIHYPVFHYPCFSYILLFYILEVMRGLLEQALLFLLPRTGVNLSFTANSKWNTFSNEHLDISVSSFAPCLTANQDS